MKLKECTTMNDVLAWHNAAGVGDVISWPQIINIYVAGLQRQSEKDKWNATRALVYATELTIVSVGTIVGDAELYKELISGDFTIEFNRRAYNVS